MKECKRFFVIGILVVTGFCGAFAQDLKFEIPKLDASKLGWGRHTFQVKIVNNSGYLKFAAISSVVTCNGGRLTPAREVIRFYSVYPEDSLLGEGVIQIPGNYGEINYDLKLYDVVDTLDILLESQVVDKQSGKLSFPAPNSIAPLVNATITLPPLVGQHVDFDNNFSQILPFLLEQGKTIPEIAKMAGCDTSFVIEQLDYMMSRGYFQLNENVFQSKIAAITEKEAAKESALAQKVAESIATKLAVNYASYRTEIDSLVGASLLTKDSNSFMDGGAILYKPYPVVTCFLLWYDLGSKFISIDSPLYLFDGTDLCNAHIPNYMYLVAGDPANNGQQHFAFIRNYRSYQLFYGDTIPKIVCPEGFMYSQITGMRVSWEYEQPYYPEGFMADTGQVRPMLNHLRKGIPPILDDASKKLTDAAHEFKRDTVSPGQRYWFWNIVASKVVAILTSNGTLTKFGSGQYRIDGMSSNLK